VILRNIGDLLHGVEALGGHGEHGDLKASVGVEQGPSSICMVEVRTGLSSFCFIYILLLIRSGCLDILISCD
jgi:hypothetical protein